MSRHPGGVSGAVLAGGSGRRFGGPKGQARIAGRSLVERAVSTLRAVCPDVVVVSSLPVDDAAGASVVPDRRQGLGPLAGLETALAAAQEGGHGWVLVLGCDLPMVTPPVLRALLEWRRGDPVVVPHREGGGVEPLCGLYSVEVLPRVAEALEAGERSLHDLIRAVGATVVEPHRLGAGPGTFLNVNAPADAAEAEHLLAREGGRLGPPTVCVVGKKKSGKTTTVVGLLAALAARGHRVMSVKHGHEFRLDTPGTDSWRHRHEGGARRVVLAGPDEMALTGAWGVGGEEPLEDLVARYLADADVVVAEGFKNSGAWRVEIFRSSVHDAPLYGADSHADGRYLAILTDEPDRVAADVPILDADDPLRFERLASLVEARFGLAAGGHGTVRVPSGATTTDTSAGGEGMSYGADTTPEVIR